MASTASWNREWCDAGEDDTTMRVQRLTGRWYDLHRFDGEGWTCDACGRAVESDEAGWETQDDPDGDIALCDDCVASMFVAPEG